MSGMPAKDVEAGLVRELRAVKAGNKPHLGEIRRSIGCTTTELSAAIGRMRFKGQLHWTRLELSPSMLIEYQEASGTAREASSISSLGEVERIEDRASPTEPAAPPPPPVLPSSVERVRKLAAADATTTVLRNQAARRIGGRLDHDHGLGSRTRALGVEVDADLAAALEAERAWEKDVRGGPSAVIRRCQRDWPALDQRVRALAQQSEEKLGVMWERALSAGVAALEEEMEAGQ